MQVSEGVCHLSELFDLTKYSFAATDKYVVLSDYLREKQTDDDNGVATLTVYDATQANSLVTKVNITVHKGIYLNAPYRIKMLGDHVVFYDSLYTRKPNITVFDFNIATGVVTKYQTSFPNCQPYSVVPFEWDLVPSWKNASDTFPVFVFAQSASPNPLEHFCALPMSSGADFKMPETAPLQVQASANTYVQFHRGCFGPNHPCITFRTAPQQVNIDGGELIVYDMVSEAQRWPMNEILTQPPMYQFNSYYERIHYISGEARVSIRNGILVYAIGNGGLFEYNLNEVGKGPLPRPLALNYIVQNSKCRSGEPMYVGIGLATDFTGSILADGTIAVRHIYSRNTKISYQLALLQSPTLSPELAGCGGNCTNWTPAGVCVQKQCVCSYGCSGPNCESGADYCANPNTAVSEKSKKRKMNVV